MKLEDNSVTGLLIITLSNNLNNEANELKSRLINMRSEISVIFLTTLDIESIYTEVNFS